ncbi:MAG TPA: LysE family transporter, partial [Dongiaceae bacterium]
MHSSFWLMLAGIAAVNLMGAASPGPAFFVVSRTAVGQSRHAGLATAYGVVLATMIWAFATIHGLALLFERAPWLLQLLQVLGGAYLLYLAFRAFRHAGDPLPTPDPEKVTDLGKAFRR